MANRSGKTEFFAKWLGGRLVINNESVSTGKRFFVSSVDGATANSGFGPDDPLATIDAAVGQCTAGDCDIIYVMPGHIETVSGAAGLDLDVQGIKVIGLGHGDLRPKVQLTASASTVECNADDMWIENIIFEGTFTNGVVAGVDVKTGCDDLTFKNCVFRGTATTKELLKAVTIEATNDRISFIGCEFFEFATGDATAAIFTEGAFTNLLIDGCTFTGDWSVAALDMDAAAVTAQGLTVRNCYAMLTDVTAGACFVTLDNTTVANFTAVQVHGRISNTPPIDAGDDGATSVIECYGAELGGTYGVIWPLAATNYGA